MRPETPVKFDGDQTVGSKVIALSYWYSGLEQRDLLLNDKRFHIYSNENSIRKLFYNSEGYQTV